MQRIVCITALSLLFLTVAGCTRTPERKPAPPPAARKRPDAYGPEFQAIWRIQRPEVARYQLTSGNGAGTAFVEFALERISASSRTPAPELADAFEAMRVTVYRHYERSSSSTTAWIALDDRNGYPAGSAAKTMWSAHSASAQSWAQSVFAQDIILQQRHGTAGDRAQTVTPTADMVAPEALPLVARRIGWPRLQLGTSRRVRLFGSLSQQDTSIKYIDMSMSKDRHTVQTPVGPLRAHRFETKGIGVWYTSIDAPHQIVAWELQNGERGALASPLRTEPGAER